MAAFMQAWRNAFQKQLSTTVDVYGVTLARFIFALPLALIYISCLYHFQPLTESVHFNLRFAIYVLIAALSQIAATALMVQLFKQKNYAIGVGLAKSEAVLAAIIAVVFLSDHLSLLGWFGVAVGGFAVFLMSKGRDFSDFSVQTLCIGIGSGLCFAITSLLVREASLELDNLPFIHRAAWVLLMVIATQCCLLLMYLGIFRRATLWAMWQRIGLTFRVSLCSFLASLGWFSAMSMQSVPIVKTLGQVEIIFSMLISAYFFKEKLARAEHLGILLVVIAAFLLQALASKCFDEIWHPSYFIAYGGGSLIIFALAFFLYRKYFQCRLTESGVLAMGASMSNTGFIGTAILTMLIGQHAAIYLSLTLIIENLLIVALTLVIAEVGMQQHQVTSQLLKQTLYNVIKNPVILSIVLGMLCVILNIQLPFYVVQVLEMLGKTASPIALFVIGASLVGMSLKSLNMQSVILVGFKIVLMPLTIFVLFSILPNVSQEMLYAGTLLAALPMPIVLGILGQNYGLSDKALTALMLSTIFGFIGISSLIALWW